MFKTPEVRSALFRKTVENLGALKSDSETTIAQNYLYFIQEKILHFEMLLSEDMTTLEKAERESIYDRIISGCLQSLSDSFEIFASCKEGQKEKSWTDEHTQEYISQLLDVFSLNSKDSYPHIYKFMGNKFSSPIRAAALNLVAKLSSYIVKNNEENRKVFVTHIHKISSSVFASISDEAYQVQKALWSSILFEYCSLFKDNIWEQVDIKKGFLPQLYTCLKNSGFGGHIDLYQNFTSIVSILPIFHFEESFETNFKPEAAQASKNQKKEIKEEDKEEAKGSSKKNAKKQKKNRGQGKEMGGSKPIKNSFSINEKANVMYETMKSLMKGIEVEEAIAFKEELIT